MAKANVKVKREMYLKAAVSPSWNCGIYCRTSKEYVMFYSLDQAYFYSRTTDEKYREGLRARVLEEDITKFIKDNPVEAREDWDKHKASILLKLTRGKLVQVPKLESNLKRLKNLSPFSHFFEEVHNLEDKILKRCISKLLEVGTDLYCPDLRDFV